MLDPQSHAPEKARTEPASLETGKTLPEKLPDLLLKKLTQEPWHVENEEAERCIPETGFIKDYLDYTKTTCDGAVWFQLAGAFTLLSVLASKSDYHAQSSNNRFSIDGIHLWNALVGLSGNRKSQAIEPAIKGILPILNPKAILATDGSLEAYHDCLSVRGGNGLFWRDEMETLFKQARRSYTMGLPGWMLEAYGGGPVERVTKSGGTVSVPRVRLNVIGNIPPSVLQTNTSRDDWRNGFLPRFCFWGARRVGYVDVPTRDAKTEGALAQRLRFINGKSFQLVIKKDVARILTDWYRREVDTQLGFIPDELFSALSRSQSKGFKFAALYALARVDTDMKDYEAISVEEQDVRYALEVTKLHKRSTEALFAFVGGTDEATLEQTAARYVLRHPYATTSEIAKDLGISVRYASSICMTLTTQGVMTAAPLKTGARGRPAMGYCLVSAEEASEDVENSDAPE